MSSDIIVILDHPYGKVEVSLDEWMQKGPGERDLLKPIAAMNRQTREIIPLKVIPLRYRNNILSRTLIALKLLPQPWPNKQR